ncbi:MAG: hypothetical protein HY589_03410 [Candidatus Omnitrophica bacterium]|nr:hypothetical protein [Candidatus Omnitrophota bacterium]
MNQKQIDRFFQTLNQNIKEGRKGKIEIILTGAAAGILMGGNRPSIDIDFAIECDKRHLKDMEDAIRNTSDVTGIAVNFSEDIDRWSQITFLDYKTHTRVYKTFGAVKVSVLSPAYWSIGKLARYLDPDVDDMVRVFKNNPVSCLELAILWGKALLKSPRSSASSMFKKHVEHFFKTYGLSIWGKDYEENKCLETFYKMCGINR